MANSWSTNEEKRLKKLRLDPVQDPPEKLIPLINHFKGSKPSVFAVTEGTVEPHVSRGLARKVRDLTREGKLDWVLERTVSSHRPEPIAYEGQRQFVGSQGVRAYALAQRIQRHWDDLMPTLLALGGVGSPSVHDYDLATFYSRPDVLSWPVAKGHLRRKPNGGLTVLLDTEGRLQWTYLQHHLENDPIWTALETWKGTMAEDLSARLAMLGVVIRQIESAADHGGLGWPVIPETGPTFVRMAQKRGHAVSLYYAFRLYDQAFSRSLDLHHQRYEQKDFMPSKEDAVELGGNPVVFASEAAEREEAIRFFLQEQAGLLVLPEFKSAVDAYRRAEWATEQVKPHLDRLGLALGFPPGSACDSCRDWVI